MGGLQAAAWLDAGYRVATIDLAQGVVSFQKIKPVPIAPQEDDSIWTGDRIRALRMQMSLTQAQFAEQLGVRQQTVSEWENNQYLPSRTTSKLLSLIAANLTSDGE